MANFSQPRAAAMATLVTMFTLVGCGGGGGNPVATPTPPPSTQGTAVTGVLVGPVGAQVTLQNNAADNLSVTVAPDAVAPTNKYAQTAFTFVTKLLDGAAYSVSVANKPADQTCTPFAGASGIMPVAARKIWVGCEFTFDHLVRSTNDAVVGGYSGSQSPILGGTNVNIGTTPNAYGEGRFAVFVSSIPNIAGSNTAAFVQVFWRDRLSGKTLLVSATAAGVEGNGSSWLPALSADGMTVAFESAASNLVANDTNAVSDIFVWSAAAPAAGVQRVSVGAAGVQANATSNRPSLSGDGKVVAFTSGASNLTAGVTGINAIHVYRRDLTAGTNTLISKNASGAPQEGNHPVLSEDGNRLAFSTYWPLLATDANNLWDIYVYEHSTASLKRVSLTSTFAERDQGTESASRGVAPAISGDGQYVAYATTATNVVPGDTNGLQDVFVVNVTTGSVVRASIGSTGAQGNADSPIGQGERPSLSADGKWVAFTTAATNLAGATSVVLRNWETNETRAMNNANTAGGPVSMTRTGAYVAFWNGTPLDAKFPGSSGLFARFTGLQRAFTWFEN